MWTMTLANILLLAKAQSLEGSRKWEDDSKEGSRREVKFCFCAMFYFDILPERQE